MPVPIIQKTPEKVTRDSFSFGRSVRQSLKVAGFAAWAVGTMALVTYLMALHAVPLPASASTPAGLVSSSAPSWRETHVLAAGCPCSGTVANDLLQRGPARDWTETVYVAADPTSEAEAAKMATRLATRGFAVKRITPEELQSELGVRGAPWLLWTDPQGQTRYSGGYAAQRPRPGVALDDVSILHRLQGGELVSGHPAFGCAIDPSLKKKLDPLAFKYPTLPTGTAL